MPESSEEPVVDPLARARTLLGSVDPAEHFRSIAALARHSEGLLQPLAYSPAHRFMDPRVVSVDPDPSGFDTLHLYARAAYPEFDRVLLAAFSDPNNDHLLNDLYRRLVLDGRNVALVTNHGEIVDIALVLAAFILAMADPKRRLGVLGETVDFNDFTAHLNVLVSRMVTTRQAFQVPAIQVLQSFCRTWLSIPQTQSRRRVKLDTEYVKANNLVMRHELSRQLDEGGQLLAMAASGSQDLSLAANLVQKVRHTWQHRRGAAPEHGPSLHLQPLYDGTIHLMLGCEDVLPIAISLDPEHPACVLGPVTRVREPEHCHAVMEWIAAAHERATGVSTVYHQHEDPLLRQVRDVMRS